MKLIGTSNAPAKGWYIEYDYNIGVSSGRIVGKNGLPFKTKKSAKEILDKILTTSGRAIALSGKKLTKKGSLDKDGIILYYTNHENETDELKIKIVKY